MSTIAIAAINMADNNEISGGISGYQADYIGLQFIKDYRNIEGPFKLIKYEDMLYPQYSSNHQKQ